MFSSLSKLLTFIHFIELLNTSNQLFKLSFAELTSILSKFKESPINYSATSSLKPKSFTSIFLEYTIISVT